MHFIIEICMHPLELNIVVCSQMMAGVILSTVDFMSPSILWVNMVLSATLSSGPTQVQQ